MIVEYHAFHPNRRVASYLGQSGDEPNGLILPYAVMDAHAIAVSSRTPEMFVVTGERCREDGKTFLDFGITRDFIEATSDFREVDGRMVYVCPSCDGKSGQHSRGCERR